MTAVVHGTAVDTMLVSAPQSSGLGAQLRYTWAVIQLHRRKFGFWLGFVLAGLIVAIVAAGTVRLFYFRDSLLGVGPEEVLLTSMIALASTGYEYVILKRSEEDPMPLWVAFGWMAIPLLTFALLVAWGMERSPLEERFSGWFWFLVAALAAISMVWAARLWATNVQGTDKVRNELARGVPAALSHEAKEFAGLVPTGNLPHVPPPAEVAEAANEADTPAEGPA